MCGIAGIVRITPAGDTSALTRTHEQAIPEHWLDTLDAGIKHRGPDGQGRFRDRSIAPDGTIVDVALVHRRLSIIDLACGSQPMVLRAPIENRARSVSEGAVSESHASPTNKADHSLTLRALKSLPPPLLFQGSPDSHVEYREVQVKADDDLIATVFNGCIYNHRKLRTELSALGHQFASDHSDTEVLLHGHRAWGLELASHLDGMFAAAIWDRRNASLTLMRDLFGEKPLYYAPIGDGFVFASVPAAIIPLQIRFAHRSFHSTSWSDILATGWIASQGQTACYPIRVLSPGETRRFTDSMIAPRLTPVRPVDSARQFPAAQSRPGILSSHLRAVASRLESDVPVSVFLSGGIDSSLITAYARKHVRDLQTFCVRMPDARYDESTYAAQVAQHLGTYHTTLEPSISPAQDLVQLIEQFGLPLGDSSLLAQYWVSKATRQHTRVALGGDGGDELFAGYERYQAAEWLARFGGVLSALPAGALPRGHAKSRWSKLARLIEAAQHSGYPELLAIFPSAMLTELGVTPKFRDRIDATDPHHVISQAIGYDIEHYLPDDLLCKVDTAAMSVALETRCPMLARELAMTALHTPIETLMPRGQRKALLKALARRHLPAHLVDRPKMGFAIPIGEWFRSDFGGMKTLLLDHLHAREPFGPEWLRINLNLPYVHQLIDEHMSEQRDHAQRLYWLLVLSIWARWMVKVRAASQPAG